MAIRRETVEMKFTCIPKKFFKSLVDVILSCEIFEKVGELINSTLPTAASPLNEETERMRLKIIAPFL